MRAGQLSCGQLTCLNRALCLPHCGYRGGKAPKLLAGCLAAQAVNLWLGAGVMLEYPLEDAQQLLVSLTTLCILRAKG